MFTIKFSNGVELPIVMCYNHGKRYIHGETRNSRDVVLPDGVVGLDELKALLIDPANLSVIEVTVLDTVEVVAEDGSVSYEQRPDTEVLYNFVYADEIKDKMNGEIWFTLGEKSALEIENELAIATIDELLIALEV